MAACGKYVHLVFGVTARWLPGLVCSSCIWCEVSMTAFAKYANLVFDVGGSMAAWAKYVYLVFGVRVRWLPVLSMFILFLVWGFDGCLW